MGVFHSPTFGELTLTETVIKIKEYLEENPKATYSLIIGTDSHEKNTHDGKKTLHIVTAIVVYKKGNGGRYFWRRKNHISAHTLREKIYIETMESLNFAIEFIPLLKITLNGKSPVYDLEIHVDVGERGQTREMIKEVVGMVTGNGFIAKTKPYAYGASYVADKHT